MRSNADLAHFHNEESIDIKVVNSRKPSQEYLSQGRETVLQKPEKSLGGAKGDSLAFRSSLMVSDSKKDGLKTRGNLRQKWGQIGADAELGFVVLDGELVCEEGFIPLYDWDWSLRGTGIV